MNFASGDEVQAFRDSGHFDEDWYVEEYPDVKLVGMDPAEHYLWLGVRLGRRPSANFDASISVRRSSRKHPLKASVAVHTTPPRSADGVSVRTRRSKKKKVCPGSDFDRRVSLLASASILDPEFVCKQLGLPLDADRTSAAEEYYRHIKDCPLRPNPLFDPEYYRHANALSYNIDPVEHYLTEGAKSHLPCHYLFDGDWYKSQLPEAASADDLLEHYWAVGYRRGLLPVDPKQTNILPEVERLFFADERQGEDPAFDPWFYRQFNADLDHMDDAALSDHFSKYGRAEGRIGSLSGFFQSSDALPRFVPIDFVPDDYRGLHLDISQVYPEGSFRTLEHYLSGGMAEGRAYNLQNLYGYFSPTDRKFSIELIDTQDRIPLCLLVHLYYPEMWMELRDYIRNIEVPFDLLINLVETTWTTDVLWSIRKDFPNAQVHISANSGRDIGGFIRLMDSVDFTKYVAIALMHSKKSPHVTKEHASRWKESLLSAIMGSPEIVAQNVAAFIEDPSIGIIGSAQNRHTMVAKNAEEFDRLLDLYGIDDDHRDCEYISGTMMMVRSELMHEIYTPIKDQDFQSGDGKALSFHMDGQLEHAVERIFGNVMKQNGMKFLWR